MSSPQPHNEPTPDWEGTQVATAEQEAASSVRSAVSTPQGYELRDEVGRGGMGVVYRAHDLSLDREVALKLLLDQYAPQSTIAVRFLEEARITGQLQHPGIPAVHQVGMLPNGRPYLAMKLIKGDTLDHLLKARADVATDRGKFIAIFEGIAQALAYAHSRRVIHRDLKPANIMVGAFGEVQVMDWGLAKVLTNEHSPRDSVASATDTTTNIRSPRDSDSDTGTQYGQFMGTPAFMPPEQAIGAVDRIDERSDVFGLGAILCVMLTGKPPFSGGDAETTRQLAARGKVEDAFARLEVCGAEPELIALAKRCLAAEREDRPAHAGELAKAIAEYRTAAEDRAKKLELERATSTARRRVLARAAAVVFAVLAAGIGASVWQAIRATEAEKRTANQLVLTQEAEVKERAAKEEAVEQRQAAEKQEQIADRRREESMRQQLRAELISRFHRDVISQSNSWTQLGRGEKPNPNLTIREAVDRTTKLLTAQFQNDPDIEARIREEAGRAYFGMGLYPQAEVNLKRAVELIAKKYPLQQIDQDDLLLTLGRAYLKQGKYAEAEPLFLRVKELREKNTAPEDPERLRSLERLAELRSAQGRPDEAERLLREVATTFEKTVGFERQATLIAWMNAAGALRETGKYDEATVIYERVLKGCEKTFGADQPTTLFAMNNLALAYADQSKQPAAEKLYRTAIAGLTKTFGPEHDETLVAQLNLALCLQAQSKLPAAIALGQSILKIRQERYGPLYPNTLFVSNFLALAYRDSGNSDEAEKLLLSNVEGLKTSLGPTHPDVAVCLTNLAETYRFSNHLVQAEKAYLEALALRETQFGPEHPLTLDSVNNLGTLREAQGRYSEAETLFRRVIAHHEKHFGPHHRLTAMCQFNLGYVFSSQNRFADAEPWLKKSYDARLATLGFENYDTLGAANMLAMAYEGQRKFAEAEPLLRKLLNVRERNEPQFWTTANTRSRLGAALVSRKKFDEAQPLILDSFEELKVNQRAIPPMFRGLRLREAAERAVKFFDATDKPEEAAKWRAIASEYRELAPPPR